MPMQATEHRDFSGGENLADNRKVLRPDQVVLLENGIITGHNQTQKRLGMTYMPDSVQFPGRIDYLYPFRPNQNTLIWLVIADQKLSLPDGTLLLDNLGPGPYSMAEFGGKVYLVDGTSFYVTDGTPEGSEEVELPDEDEATLTVIKRCTLLLTVRDRLWAAGDPEVPYAVYYSQPEKPTYFKEDDHWLYIGQHDSAPVNIFTEAYGGILVGKPTGFWRIMGDPAALETIEVQRIITSNGPTERCFASDGADLWYIHQKRVYMLRQKEQSVWEVPYAGYHHAPLHIESDWSKAVMTYFDGRIMHWFHHPDYEGDGNNLCSVADLRFTNEAERRYAAWSRFTNWPVSAVAQDGGSLWAGLENGYLVKLFDGTTDLGEPIPFRLHTPEYTLGDTFLQKWFHAAHLEIAQTGLEPVRPTHEVVVGLRRQKNEWHEAFLSYAFNRDDDFNSGTHDGTKTENNKLTIDPRTTVEHVEDSQEDFEEGTLVDVVATEDGLTIDPYADEDTAQPYREHEVDLTPVVEVGESLIEWDADEPHNSSVTVETSVDDGETWQEAENGQPIPGLTDSAEVLGKELKWRQNLGFGDLADVVELPAPDVTPSVATYNFRSVGVSPDGRYVGIALERSSSYPYVFHVYKVVGNSLIKLGPDFSDTVGGRSIAFSPGNTPLVAVGRTTAPTQIYRIENDVLVGVGSVPIPGGGTGLACAFSPDGKYLAVGGTSPNYLRIYRIEGTTFTAIFDPTTSNRPAGLVNKLAFSPDSQYLAVAHENSPYITIYKIENDVVTMLPNPSPRPLGNGLTVAFNPSGDLLVVGHVGSTGQWGLTIYQREGDTFTKLPDIPDVPLTRVEEVSFNPSGTLLLLGHFGSSFGVGSVRLYKVNGTEFTLPPFAQTPVVGTSSGLAFIDDTRFIVRQGPTWYKISKARPTLKEFHIRVSPKFPHAAAWESPEIELTAVGRYQESILQYEAEEFDGSVEVYTRVSLDGGETWSQYTRQLNGEPIAGLNHNDDLSNAILQIKVVLTTNSEGNEPKVDLLAALFGFRGSVQRRFQLRPRLRGTFIQHRIEDSSPENVSVLAVGEVWRPLRHLRPSETEGSIISN